MFDHYCKFVAESVLKELYFKSLNIWQSYGGKYDCLRWAVRGCIALLKKMKNLKFDERRAKTVVTASPYD